MPKTNRWLVALAIVVVVSLAVTITAAVWPDRTVRANFKIEQAKTTTSTPEPEPLIPPGVKTWSDVETWIKRADAGTAGNVVPAGYGDFFELRTGWSREDVHNFAVAQKAGQPLTVLLKKGRVITNTGYSRSKKKFLVYSGFVLKQDRVVLVAPKGYVPVKQRRMGLSRLLPAVAYADGMQNGASTNCGNAVQFGPEELAPQVSRPEQPQKPEKKIKKPKKAICPPQKPPRNKFPWTTPHHPDNPSTQQPKDNTRDTDVRTPGVTIGVPEEAKKSQEENRDTEGAVEGGKAGQDDGGVTNPNGTHEESPRPTTPPDTTSSEQHSGDPGEPD